MVVIKRRIVFTAFIFALAAGTVTALVHDRGGISPLQVKEFSDPVLDATPINLRPSDASAFAELRSLGANPDVAFLDARSGRWRTLLFARPIIPGSGAGNDLTWDDDRPADDEALGELAWGRVRNFVASHSDSLRIDVSELKHRVAVHNGGELIQIWADRIYNGVPVRGAGFTAVINQGNLTLMGAEQWGDIALNRLQRVSAEAAVARVASFLAPMSIDSLREDSSLVILPARSASGDAYSHRLAWAVRPGIGGDLGQWEALVDVHEGGLLAFQDLNHYGADRTVTGGVYPVAYDGIAPDGNMVENYPMPFADVSSGGFTDAGGNFSGAGSVTTTLSGQFVNIQEFCGAISETSTGDIDLEGTNGDFDCAVPAGHSVGNTAAARSGFYELNRIKALALGQLPGNAWLNATLTAQMNISPVCNAFWTGSVVQLTLETFPCGNTGQLAGALDHEWGHGMDDNDVNGSITGFSQGGGEGMADVYAALRLNQGCIGRGFFQNGAFCGGYGDPCTPASGCTGIRSVDFADRTSGVPHDLTWVRANCGSVHCLGAAYSEAIWDLLKRDLPNLHAMDNNTALEVTTRLTFIGAGNASGWFDTSGPPVDAAACGATQAYLQFLAADDDDGNINNGTPHMDAIASAFDRHEIGCTPANGGPTVTVSGCVGTPITAPTLSAATTDMGADLSWDSIPGATSYNVYRTDGERECDFGKELVGSTAGTAFSDSGLLNERPYYYVVTPMGASASCFGPTSNCAMAGIVDFNLVPTPASLDVCAPTDPDPTVDINVTSIGGWSFAVNLVASGEPPGTTSTLVPNDQLPDFTSVYTLLGTGTSTTGTYTIEFAGTGSDAPPTLKSTQVVLNLAVADPGLPALTVPVDGASDQSLAQTLAWTAGTDAISYDLEVATDAGFTNIIYSMTDLPGLSHTLPSPLDPTTTYHWRVTANNACGTITTGGFSFTTVQLFCEVFDSTDVPLSIPEGGGTSGSTTSILTIDAVDSGTIFDVNILNLTGTHTFMGDLDFNLDSPAATSLRVLDQDCGTAENFDLNLDDAAAPGSPPCPPTDGGIYQPANPLSVFNGENSSGAWTLTINDNAASNSGQLDSWSLKICVEGNTAPRLTIVSPEPNASFPSGAIPFAAFANDKELGDLTSTISWEVEAEGPLGPGGCFSSPISAGTYTATATVTDGDITTTDNVTFTSSGPVAPSSIATWEPQILHEPEFAAPRGKMSIFDADLKLEMSAGQFVCPGTMGYKMSVTNLDFDNDSKKVKVCNRLHGSSACTFSDDLGTGTLLGTGPQTLANSDHATNPGESVGPGPMVFFLFTSGCENDIAGGVPTCDLGDMPEGTSKGYTITACVLGAGAMTNKARVEAATPDPDLLNNEASFTTIVTPAIFADGFESGDTSAWDSVVPFSTY